ncbi:MAG: GNAT family N-acetyltransferase [Candidatus Marinimicrobia bacterium]|nr:GNAT family N-acetyltransferase [Candidatus Neomarinimicrobiota bacterium]
MAEPNFQPDKESTSKVIASSGPFQIELMKKVGSDDYPILIRISETLADKFGTRAKLTPNTIQVYFNREGSLPFIARYQGDIIGYIIGVPIEILDREPWARTDVHFGENNTLYTYAFVIESKYKGNGYAKMLKRVYLNWAGKQEHLKYMTGHVMEGIAKNFTMQVTVVNLVANWQGTSKVFEYYRRTLDP